MIKNLLQSKIISYGSILLAIAFITALVVRFSSISVESVGPLVYPEADSENAKLYIERCGECHKAPLPAIHKAQDWPAVVDRMQRRMMRGSVKILTEQEYGTVLEYLQKHAEQKSTKK